MLEQGRYLYFWVGWAIFLPIALIGVKKDGQENCPSYLKIQITTLLQREKALS